MADHAALESFVRETLGCGCPAEVLRDIRVEPPCDECDGALQVGGRLLVLFLRLASLAECRQRLPGVLERGRGRREAEGFNRIRYVVFAGDEAVIREAQALFDGALEGDARAHLHCLPAEARPL
jgi:hypothetical protein